jgi:hypothetical protein
VRLTVVVMFLYYYATIGVVTPPAMHVVTVLLTDGPHPLWK